jgi:hypothetical protein
MGTRGVYGFRYRTRDFLTYNHFDSYPSGLGNKVLEFCQQTSVAKMKAICDRIILVDLDHPVSGEQIAECCHYYCKDVSKGTPRDWYALLRKSQGDLDAYKKGLRYMIDYNDFIRDSLFCEYGYIVNLDTGQMEIYIGSQKKPQIGNRYGKDPNPEGYYPCALVKRFPLDCLPESLDDLLAEGRE